MLQVERYIEENQELLHQLIRELCAIPAPSHNEGARAAYCRDWLLAQGATDVTIDTAQNTICRIEGEGEDVVILMAHTDTVFPDLEPMPFREEDGRMYCPGVGDDTANLAVLLLLTRYVLQAGLKPNCTLLIVANACEEGLGNLKGCRQLMADYGDRVREVISFDGYIGGIANDAVGSMRYRVTLRTEGGHSFANFGNKNAIHYLSMMIADLYKVTVPPIARTTYNVGTIEGGTSVNTIAQEASMLYEYRSENAACLEQMQRSFENIVENYRRRGVEIEVEVLGVRPCKQGVNEERQAALTARLAEAIARHTGEQPQAHASSTDCNVPLSMGIPAVCTGVCRGGGAHTRGEWIALDSLPIGCSIAAEVLLHYFEKA